MLRTGNTRKREIDRSYDSRSTLCYIAVVTGIVPEYRHYRGDPLLYPPLAKQGGDKWLKVDGPVPVKLCRQVLARLISEH